MTLSTWGRGWQIEGGGAKKSTDSDTSDYSVLQGAGAILLHGCAAE